MENPRGPEIGAHVAVPRGFSAAVTFIISLAVVGTAVWSDRAFSRWWAANHPLSGARARLEGARTSCRSKRETLSETALLIGEVVVDISRATARQQRAARTNSLPT